MLTSSALTRAILGTICIAAASFASNSPLLAQQTGGNGGDSANNAAHGGAGGSTNVATGAATNGGNGGSIVNLAGGGGGGGAGATAGQGGTGGASSQAAGGAGGTGGTAAVGGVGGAGGDGAPGGAAFFSGGGGGGGGGAHGAVSATLATPLTGGAGGIGGDTGAGGAGGSGGGGGGGGGYGAFITGAGGTNALSVTGGAGGAGGTGGTGPSQAHGGNAGAGGVGVFFASGTTGTLTNSGTIQGGTGGVGGAGGASGLNGAGGAGVVGANLTVTNSGTIAGGLGGDGVTRAASIIFTGGTNSLQFGGATADLTGDIKIQTGSVDFNQIVIPTTVSNNITGAGGLIKSNNGRIFLSGANSYTGSTTVNGGALSGAATNTFSATSATTINAGGILDLGGLAQTINSVTLAGGQLGHGSLSGAVTSTDGALSDLGGSMTLTVNSGTTTVITTPSHNTYSGATVVNNGATLLAILSNSFSAVSATTINTGGTVDLGGFPQAINIVTLAGGTLTNGGLTGAVISAGGTLNGLDVGFGIMTLTVNSGTTNVTGTNTFTGTVTVNGGLLSVNGTSTGSPMTVNAGGTLGGNGTVGNTTINGGTLAPGNSIGTLTVAGNLIFTAAASYMVEVSPANADRTNVTGTATLGGATVYATFAPGAYVAKRYTIVNATGGLGGSTFGSIVNTNLPGVFKSNLSYDANNAYLNLDLALAQLGALSGNQQNVANALTNFFNTSGGIPLVFGTLTPAGLAQVSGETATGSQQTTFNAMNQFMGVMTDPFIAGRGDPISSGGNPSAYAEEGSLAYAASGKSRSKNERDAYAAITTKAPPLAPAFEQRWSVWGAGFGGSQTTDGNTIAGSNNTRSSIYGAAAGADYRISPNTLAGFALAGGGTSFSVNGFGSGRSDLFQAGAFIRHNVGPAYITGALAYGWQDITTDRTVTVAGVDRLRAQFNANTWSGRVEGGYRFVSQGFGWTPYAAAQFTTFELPDYAEKVIVGANTFALAYNARSVSDSRSELGLRTDKSFAMPNGIFTLRGRAAWAHDFNPDRSIGATFQTLPGASFVVNGARQAADAALVTGSAEMKWINGWSTAATFEGEFSNVTQSYAGKGVVRYAW